MFSKSFTDMEIPAGYGLKQLLFSPAAKVLVVQTQSGGANWRPERLYFRHGDWDKYLPVGTPGDLISQESPFVHQSKPLLAYNSVQHLFTVDAEGEERHSGDWDSLKIFDLENQIEVVSIDPKTLQLPPGITRAWICEVVAYGDFGLFVKAGSSSGQFPMDYFVAELDIRDRTFKPLVSLPAVFM